MFKINKPKKTNQKDTKETIFQDDEDLDLWEFIKEFSTES